MKTKTNDRRYWDACNFIAIINHEGVKGAVCQAILDDARSDSPRVQICTSILTIAEVVKPKNCVGLTPEKDKEIDDFFDNDWIIAVNIDRATMREARSLQRQYKMKTKDAIHIASAMFAEVDVVETYDEDLLLWNNKIPNPIGPTPLQIRGPVFGYGFVQLGL